MQTHLVSAYDWQKRFIREAKTLARIRHKHLAQVYSVGFHLDVYPGVAPRKTPAKTYTQIGILAHAELLAGNVDHAEGLCKKLEEKFGPYDFDEQYIYAAQLFLALRRNDTSRVTAIINDLNADAPKLSPCIALYVASILSACLQHTTNPDLTADLHKLIRRYHVS